MTRWLPSREDIRRSRWLGPVARYADDDRLWRSSRASVARAVGIGLFFGLLLPVAQFFFAIVVAIALRAHVAIAAAATLITNPLTVAPIYWLAWRIGDRVLGGTATQAPAGRVTERLAAMSWQDAFTALHTVGAPVLVGLALLAVVGSALGFALVWLLWRPAPRTPPS